MERGYLFASFSLSASLHFLVLVALTLALPVYTGRGAGGPLSVELWFDPAGLPGPAVMPPPRPEAAAPPPPPSPVPREVFEPARPRAVDGVRVATPEQIERRREELVTPATVPEPEIATAPVPEAGQEVARAPVETEVTPAARPARGSPAGNRAGSDGPGAGTTASPVRARPVPRTTFRPDALGYDGRVLGQMSVRSGSSADAFYGRVHLFADDGSYRDWSDTSLFGFSFRHELPDGGVRDFQVGRVQTHAAYLVVTDLFPNGRISTMSHTVVLPFPRESPAGGPLWDVVEEPSGDFRLRGPAGSSLRFDGRNGALFEASGLVVRPAGATGTPPDVGFRGLHVRVHAVGGNPFSRGRPATVVDGNGSRCGLTTSDLFAYDGGRRESDVFRFRTDREFFAFLSAQCSWLSLPRPADVQIAKEAGEEPRPKRTAGGGGGLLQGLFRAFGGE